MTAALHWRCLRAVARHLRPHLIPEICERHGAPPQARQYFQRIAPVPSAPMGVHEDNARRKPIVVLHKILNVSLRRQPFQPAV